MNRIKVAKELVALAKMLTAGDAVVATNRSSWSWEDDADWKTATVTVDDVGQLTLTVTHVHEKYGIGAGRRESQLYRGPLGSVTNPKIGQVMSLIGKWSHDRTSAGGPFSRLWTTPDRRQVSLRDAVAEVASRFSGMIQASSKVAVSFNMGREIGAGDGYLVLAPYAVKVGDVGALVWSGADTYKVMVPGKFGQEEMVESLSNLPRAWVKVEKVLEPYASGMRSLLVRVVAPYNKGDWAEETEESIAASEG